MSEDMATICPFCDQHHEAVTLAYGELPFADDGDVTLCFDCGQFCVFDRDAHGGLRKPTKKEQRCIARDDRLQKLLTAWKIVKRQ
jgi:hypothetical protein